MSCRLPEAVAPLQSCFWREGPGASAGNSEVGSDGSNWEDDEDEMRGKKRRETQGRGFRVAEATAGDTSTTHLSQLKSEERNMIEANVVKVGQFVHRHDSV